MVSFNPKAYLLNTIIISYYASMPLIATGILIFRTGESNYSYIRAINIVFAFFALLYFLYIGKTKLETYQKYFLAFTFVTIILDALRGQFWVVSKSTIESACLIIATSSFILTPKMRDKLIRIFIFYIIASFIVVLIQRIFGIYWDERFEIIRYSPDEFHKYRFAGFWYSIDQISGITVLTLLTALVCIDLLKQRRKGFALLLTSILLLTAVLSGSRAFMLYSIILMFGFLIYSSKDVTKRIIRISLILLIIFLLLFALGKYGISLKKIWTERIYQSDKPFEERSESARTENISFFFTSDYFTFFGSGFKFSEEYKNISGRHSAGLLIGMLNPMFGYGIFSVFYYLFWYALLRKVYLHYRLTKNTLYIAVISGFILVGFTAGFTYLANMHAFFLLLFLKTDYASILTHRQINKEV